MAQVTIYTRPGCGYCARALSVLNEKGADFTEVHAGAVAAAGTGIDDHMSHEAPLLTERLGRKLI